jgi:hypothetical protein
MRASEAKVLDTARRSPVPFSHARAIESGEPARQAMATTQELLKDVEQMQRRLKIASLQGAYAVIRKLAINKGWSYREQNELLNQAEAIQWAIDELGAP